MSWQNSIVAAVYDRQSDTLATCDGGHRPPLQRGRRSAPSLPKIRPGSLAEFSGVKRAEVLTRERLALRKGGAMLRAPVRAGTYSLMPQRGVPVAKVAKARVS